MCTCWHACIGDASTVSKSKGPPSLFSFQNLPTGIWMHLVWYASFWATFALRSQALCTISMPHGCSNSLQAWVQRLLSAGLFMVFNSSGVWVCFLSFLSHVGSLWGSYYLPREKRKTAPNPHTFSDSESCFKSSVLTVSSIMDPVRTSGGSVSACDLIFNSVPGWSFTLGC